MGLSANDMASKQGTNGTPSSYAAKHNLASHFIGGNDISVAPPSKVKEFVQAHGGHTVITNVSAMENYSNGIKELQLTRCAGPHCK